MQIEVEPVVTLRALGRLAWVAIRRMMGPPFPYCLIGCLGASAKHSTDDGSAVSKRGTELTSAALYG